MDNAAELTGQSYREQRPLPPLRHLITTVWVQRVGAQAPAYANRSLPNGCVELQCPVGGEPRLVGPVSSASTYVLAPGTTLVGVRFRPEAAAAFGVPSAALADDAVDAREIWGDLAEGSAHSWPPRRHRTTPPRSSSGCCRPDCTAVAPTSSCPRRYAG